MRAPDATPRRRRAARGQRGLSLVELMIGIAIGLALVAAVVQGYAMATGNSAVNSGLSEMQTNGRYAMESLKREVRHAALSPLLWDASQLAVNGTAAARNYGCGAGVSTQLAQGVEASNDANPFAAGCLATGSDRSYARGDVLVVRRLASETATVFAANAPYARVSYGSGNVFLGGETPPPLPAPVYDHALVSDVYFINAFTHSADESPRVPALYRLTLSGGANPSLVPELVASNVEHLQLQFGVGDGSGNLRFLNANAVTDWTRVNSVRVWLLLRASEPEAGLASETYTLGDISYRPADSHRRVLLASTIEVRNR